MPKQPPIFGKVALLLLACTMIGLDQFTKHLARHALALYQPQAFLPQWNWTLVYNEGAAFSFLAQQNGWQKIFFTIIALTVAIGIIYYVLTKAYNWVVGIGLSLILSGALGNLIDRLLMGKVTDFIDWYIGAHHWPAFNVADSCVTVGVTLLIIDNIFNNSKPSN